jgi:hypothetical protein
MRDMQTFDTSDPGAILDRIWERLMDADMEETDTFNPSLNNQVNWMPRCIVAGLRHQVNSKPDTTDPGDSITQ